MSEINSSLSIHNDLLSRKLYSSDASLYEEVPAAVAFPKTTGQLIELVRYAKTHSQTITMRTAGTSLAGQATGHGIIADVSRYMGRILDYQPEQRTIRVEPGVIRDVLNHSTAIDGLFFAPDTSTTNRCMIGGMIANNSSGSYSIKYGTTREHVLEISAVLDDGSTAVFRPLQEQELEEKLTLSNREGEIYRHMIALLHENRDRILEHAPHPEIFRRNTGYALDQLCLMHPITKGGRPFNMCELLAGSEGTLAIISDALLKLTPVAKFKMLLISQFQHLDDALRATVEAVKKQPAAVELADKWILDATKGNPVHRKNRFFLKGDPEALLIIEFQGDDVSRLKANAMSLARELELSFSGSTHSVIENETDMKRIWDLRKAGLGLLMGHLSDANSPEFVDDTAVRVSDLPDYIRDFRKIMDAHGLSCVYYAHASAGELHLRPILNLKTEKGLETMKTVAVEVADLVKKYRGSLSGEHGDGRLRAHLIERTAGADLLALFRKVKKIWDPDTLFNKGKIVDPEPMESHLRYSPLWKDMHVPTVFKWRETNGFGKALEQCNGAGECRKLPLSGGMMCPSYRATLNEKDSTRGRANMFRQIFSEQNLDAFSSDLIKEALSLCLSCKACKNECPANVDMAKMKAEFTHGWHQLKGLSFEDRLWGNPARLYTVASLFPKLFNHIVRKKSFKKLFQIHPDRQLPSFAKTSFFKRHLHHNKTARQHPDNAGIVLLVDYYCGYHEPNIPASALKLLEEIGFSVVLHGPFQSGRTHISRGLLDKAQKIAEQNIRELSAYVDDGYLIAGLEPGEILTMRDEYTDLFDGHLHEKALELQNATYLIEELLTKPEISPLVQSVFNGRGETVFVQSHCHSKILSDGSPISKVLKLTNHKPEILSSGCCGIAGSFGYETKNYDVSMEIGALELFPAIQKTDSQALICAHGFSCRHQIKDGTGRISRHPVEIIWNSRKG